MMSHKEKAQELVNRFMFAGIYFTDGINGARKNAKQCAVIAVDEIIKSLKISLGHLDLRALDLQEYLQDILYWEEVKHELNKSE